MSDRRILLLWLLWLVICASCSGSRESGPKAVVLQSQGRFTAFTDGTVLDTTHGLMWSSIDFRRDVDWFQAEAFCRIFSVGGYGDWRLPTIEELQTLYDVRKTGKNGYHTTPLIRISGQLWASDFRILMNTVPDYRTDIAARQLAGTMDLKTGKIDFTDAHRNVSGFRILPVRSVD